MFLVFVVWCVSQGLEWTGGSQNGADHMVGAKKGTQGSELTLCAGVRKNGAGHVVKTEHPFLPEIIKTSKL